MPPRSMLKKRKPKRSLTDRIRSKKKRAARKPRVLTVPAKKQVSTIVRREISRQSETLRNFGRLTYQPAAQTGTSGFEGANYFLINLGGVVGLSGQTSPPMRTINGIPNAWNSPTASTYNQVYMGKNVFGKTFTSKINLVMPSLRTIQSGAGQDAWQSIPTNYQYRLVIFKVKDHPSRSAGATTNTQGSFTTTGFKNCIGSAFGINSPDSEAMPDPTGAPLPWTNHDLMWSPTNKTNFHILKEKRGRISVGSSAQATNNPLLATLGGSQYPCEASFSFTHKINKKLNLNYDANVPAGGLPTVAAVTNYDTTIGMFLVLSPLGEQPPIPGNQGSAAQWNDYILPYIHVTNSFSFTDM